MSKLTIEGVESAIILHFPKSGLDPLLQASFDLYAKMEAALPGYPVTTITQAYSRACRHVERHMPEAEAMDRALKWARGAVREPEEV